MFDFEKKTRVIETERGVGTRPYSASLKNNLKGSVLLFILNSSSSYLKMVIKALLNKTRIIWLLTVEPNCPGTFAKIISTLLKL